MLENINILNKYDNTVKTVHDLTSFVYDMRDKLFELENETYITIEDKFALSEWSYVLDDIYKKYHDLLVHGSVYLECIGLVHVCELKKTTYDKGD